MTLRPLSSATIRRGWFAVLLLGTVACDSNSPSRPTPVPAASPVASSLSGTVYDVTSSKVEGASVVIVDGQEIGRRSVSNGEGQYDLGELPRGTYMVKAEKPGRGAKTERVVVAGATVRHFFLPFRAPDGTFVLTGIVSEPGGLGIDSARVSVVSGTGTGLSTTSDFGGKYTLVGLGGDVTLRIEADRYVAKAERLGVEGDQQFNVELPFAVSPARLDGEHELTLQSSESCSALPDDLRRRTYSATVSQRGSHIDVRLSGATFREPPVLFGRVFGDEMTLESYSDFYYGYGIEEIVDTNTRLSIAFKASTRVRQRRAEGTMRGDFLLQGPTIGSHSCEADDHRFSLVPR